jgi:hypothetical protein
MNPWHDKLQWGNPDIATLQLISKQSNFEHLLPELKEHPYPADDSDGLKAELNSLVKLANDRAYLKPDALQRFDYYFYTPVKDQIKRFYSNEMLPDFDKLWHQIYNIAYTLAAKLAVIYNRPTPTQYARYYKLKLFPVYPPQPLPAYPFTDYTLAMVACNVFTALQPQTFEEIKTYLEDYKFSLFYQGTIFASDVNFAYIVAEKILQDKNFNKLFNI